MLRKKITIVFLPDASNRVKQFRIPQSLLLVSLLIFLSAALLFRAAEGRGGDVCRNEWSWHFGVRRGDGPELRLPGRSAGSAVPDLTDVVESQTPIVTIPFGPLFNF